MIRACRFEEVFKLNQEIKEQYEHASAFAVKIYGCIIDIYYGDTPAFVPTLREESAQNFLYEWNIFQKKKSPLG